MLQDLWFATLVALVTFHNLGFFYLWIILFLLMAHLAVHLIHKMFLNEPYFSLSERDRTSDLSIPNAALSQTELHLVKNQYPDSFRTLRVRIIHSVLI